jgi:hypothetical protein
MPAAVSCFGTRHLVGQRLKHQQRGGAQFGVGRRGGGWGGLGSGQNQAEREEAGERIEERSADQRPNRAKTNIHN